MLLILIHAAVGFCIIVHIDVLLNDRIIIDNLLAIS